MLSLQRKRSGSNVRTANEHLHGSNTYSGMSAFVSQVTRNAGRILQACRQRRETLQLHRMQLLVHAQVRCVLARVYL
jgi:hypothetical protein